MPAARIEVVTRGKTVPMVASLPVLSSAEVGWRGVLFEQHRGFPPFEVPEHRKRSYILHVHFGPCATTEWRIDGQSHRTNDEQGSVSIVAPGSEVAASVSGKDPISGIALEIEPRHVEYSLGEATSGRQVELVSRLAVPDRQIELLATAMQTDLIEGSPAGRLYGESLGNTLITYLVQRYSAFPLKLMEYKGGLTKARLTRIREYIEQRLDEKIALNELAETAGVNMYHFARAFKQSTGVTPHQYVLARKMERAKEILRDPRKSILEASARLGFVDQSHFSKTFRRLIGVTPSEYRIQC